MDKRSLRWSRSNYHPWLLRVAQFGGILVVGIGLPGGTLLAATHPEKHSTLWTVALVFVIVLAVLGVLMVLVGGVGSFLTRPASEDHSAALKASAALLALSLERGSVCNFGDGYQPGQAFAAHFPRLVKQLTAWDSAVVAPSHAEGALERHLDAAMAEHEVLAPADPEVGFNIPEITRYARWLVMARARGQHQRVPHLTWDGFTNAPSTADGHQVAGLAGVLRPSGGPDWISLPPLPDETMPQWNERASMYTQRVDGLMTTLYETALPCAQAMVNAEQELEAYKLDELPSILAALQLIQVRESPRVRHRCESC